MSRYWNLSWTLSARLVISSHLAVGSQNDLMDIQAIQVYLPELVALDVS
jgi:hypothetical protein